MVRWSPKHGSAANLSMILANSTIVAYLLRIIGNGWTLRPVLALDAIRQALGWPFCVPEEKSLCRMFPGSHQYRIVCFGENMEQTRVGENGVLAGRTSKVWRAETLYRAQRHNQTRTCGQKLMQHICAALSGPAPLSLTD